MFDRPNFGSRFINNFSSRTDQTCWCGLRALIIWLF
uniref:Uncharacterized protein n=1 Tax=Arundo donax TaxID=35708 RepID=A0A0A9KK07_ARUDO